MNAPPLHHLLNQIAELGLKRWMSGAAHLALSTWKPPLWALVVSGAGVSSIAL